MPNEAKSRRVFLLANPSKPLAVSGLAALRRFAESRCTLVGAELGLDGRPAIDVEADRIVVLGGDGTLIGVARSLGGAQIPLIGVNVGKFGFLAEFSVQGLEDSFDRVITDDRLIGRRTMLHATVVRGSDATETSLAVNDCVIQAGPPFRQIHLDLTVSNEHLSTVEGDGLIVCTASGSTAHNLSAGGPIMQSGIDAIALTPLAPHSLTHKPIVIERDSIIEILAMSTNAGTTVIIDGQVPWPLHAGNRLIIRRFEADSLIVHNPQYTRWHKLVTKLHWGRPPVYD